MAGNDDLILNLILLLLPGAFLAAFSFVAVLYRIGQIEHLKHCEYIVSSIDLEEESWGKRLFEKFWHITQCGKARHFGYSTWEMNFVRFFMVGFSVFTVVNVVIGIRGSVEFSAGMTDFLTSIQESTNELRDVSNDIAHDIRNVFPYLNHSFMQTMELMPEETPTSIIDMIFNHYSSVLSQGTSITDSVAALLERTNQVHDVIVDAEKLVQLIDLWRTFAIYAAFNVALLAAGVALAASFFKSDFLSVFLQILILLGLMFAGITLALHLPISHVLEKFCEDMTSFILSQVQSAMTVPVSAIKILMECLETSTVTIVLDGLNTQAVELLDILRERMLPVIQDERTRQSVLEVSPSIIATIETPTINSTSVALPSDITLNAIYAQLRSMDAQLQQLEYYFRVHVPRPAKPGDAFSGLPALTPETWGNTTVAQAYLNGITTATLPTLQLTRFYISILIKTSGLLNCRILQTLFRALDESFCSTMYTSVSWIQYSSFVNSISLIGLLITAFIAERFFPRPLKPFRCEWKSPMGETCQKSFKLAMSLNAHTAWHNAATSIGAHRSSNVSQLKYDKNALLKHKNRLDREAATLEYDIDKDIDKEFDEDEEDEPTKDYIKSGQSKEETKSEIDPISIGQYSGTASCSQSEPTIPEDRKADALDKKRQSVSPASNSRQNVSGVDTRERGSSIFRWFSRTSSASQSSEEGKPKMRARLSSGDAKENKAVMSRASLAPFLGTGLWRSPSMKNVMQLSSAKRQRLYSNEHKLSVTPPPPLLADPHMKPDKRFSVQASEWCIDDDAMSTQAKSKTLCSYFDCFAQGKPGHPRLKPNSKEFWKNCLFHCLKGLQYFIIGLVTLIFEIVRGILWALRTVCLSIIFLIKLLLDPIKAELVLSTICVCQVLQGILIFLSGDAYIMYFNVYAGPDSTITKVARHFGMVSISIMMLLPGMALYGMRKKKRLALRAFVIAEFFLGIFSTVLVIICSIQFHSLQNRARTLDQAKLSALLVIGITLAVFLSLVMYFTCAVGIVVLRHFRHLRGYARLKNVLATAEIFSLPSP